MHTCTRHTSHRETDLCPRSQTQTHIQCFFSNGCVTMSSCITFCYFVSQNIILDAKRTRNNFNMKWIPHLHDMTWLGISKTCFSKHIHGAVTTFLPFQKRRVHTFRSVPQCNPFQADAITLRVHLLNHEEIGYEHSWLPDMPSPFSNDSWNFDRKYLHAMHSIRMVFENKY